jgi:hypothetical protein
VAERTRYITIAVFLTVLDASVVFHYLGVIWTAWFGITWTRAKTFLLAALWTTSLTNDWVLAGNGGTVLQNRSDGLARAPAAIPTEISGEAHV